MTKKNRKKDRVDTSGDEGLKHNPFADLLKGKERAELPEGPSPEAVRANTEESAALSLSDGLSKLSKVILRRQRKGRGGRTVTLIEGLDGFSKELLTELASEMGKALGTGATQEDLIVVLQGDLRERAKQWLEQRGVQKIVLS